MPAFSSERAKTAVDSGDEPREPARLLVGPSEPCEHLGDQVVRDHQNDGECGTGAGYGLYSECRAQIIAAETTVLWWDCDAQQALSGRFSDEDRADSGPDS